MNAARLAEIEALLANQSVDNPTGLTLGDIARWDAAQGMWEEQGRVIAADLVTALREARELAERLAETTRRTVEEFYGEDGYTFNPDETAALAAFDAAKETW